MKIILTGINKEVVNKKVPNNDPAASCRVSKPKGYSPAASYGELSS